VKFLAAGQIWLVFLDESSSNIEASDGTKTVEGVELQLSEKEELDDLESLRQDVGDIHFGESKKGKQGGNPEAK